MRWAVFGLVAQPENWGSRGIRGGFGADGLDGECSPSGGFNTLILTLSPFNGLYPCSGVLDSGRNAVTAHFGCLAVFDFNG